MSEFLMLLIIPLTFVVGFGLGYLVATRDIAR